MKCSPLEKLIIHKTGIKKYNIEELRKYQLKKIVETIRYVKKKGRFYSRYLKDIDENKIKSFKNFEEIPFTCAEDLKKNPFEFLCVPQKNIKRVVTLKTSGTTGKEKRIFFTENDLKLTVEFFTYGIKAIVGKNDRVLVMFPGDSYGSIGYLLKEALGKIGVYCYIQGVMKDVFCTWKLIEDKNINCIVGIPIQILQLSRIKSDLFGNKINKLLLSSDYVPETFVKEITSRFGCRVFSHYGMTEMGYGGAVQCEALEGCHLRENDLYFEIVDPVTGKNLEAGVSGEIVFTTLTREAMPLVRYRTGDIASICDSSCGCGSFLKTLGKVRGRIDNRIKLENGRYIYMSKIDEIILSFIQVLDYRIVVENGNKMHIYLTIFHKYDFNKLAYVISEKIKKELKNDLYKIEITHSEKSLYLKNSMVKRKICNFRGGFGCEGHI